MSDEKLRDLARKAASDPSAAARLRAARARREKFDRRILVRGCYGTRGDRSDRGNHGADLDIALCGPAGAVALEIFTRWHLNPAPADGDGESARRLAREGVDGGPVATFFLHSAEPREGWTECGPCGWLDGRPCWTDSGAYAGDHYFGILIREGTDGLWKAFEERYAEEFEGS